jgi:hypothetical protein
VCSRKGFESPAYLIDLIDVSSIALRHLIDIKDFRRRYLGFGFLDAVGCVFSDSRLMDGMSAVGES